MDLLVPYRSSLIKTPRSSDDVVDDTDDASYTTPVWGDEATAAAATSSGPLVNCSATLAQEGARRLVNVYARSS